MRRTVPAMDQIARALLVHGARDAAVDLMEAVIARGGEERPRCEALLSAVRARPTDRVSGPPIALDAGLVEALAAQGRVIEAWAVTLGANVGHTVAGVEIAHALSLVMDPSELPEPWLTRWTRIIVQGNAADITAIEREVVAGAAVPSALLERMRIAWRLLKGFWSAAASDRAHASPLDPSLQIEVAQRVAQHDLAGALAILRAAAEKSEAADSGTLAVAMALARLLSAADRAIAEEGPRRASTVPLEGAPLALFHLRMGNFEDAERGLRRIVMEQPADHVARDRLADVLVLRRAIDAPVDDAPLELAKTPAPDWLNKRGRPSAGGWAAPQKDPPRKAPSHAQTGSWDDEDATSVLRADEEAELHVKAGQPERAVPIYELLVQKYPGKPRFATRLTEIRAMIAAKKAPPRVANDVGDTERPAPPKDGGDFVLEGPTSVERWRVPSAPAAKVSVEHAVVRVRPIVRVR